MLCAHSGCADFCSEVMQEGHQATMQGRERRPWRDYRLSQVQSGEIFDLQF